MIDLNSLILEGRLTNCENVNEKDNYIARFMVQERRNDEISFFDCEAYGSLAKKFPFKSTERIRIVGRLKQKNWEVAGEKFSKVIIVCEHLECLKKRIVPVEEA